MFTVRLCPAIFAAFPNAFLLLPLSHCSYTEWSKRQLSLREEKNYVDSFQIALLHVCLCLSFRVTNFWVTLYADVIIRYYTRQVVLRYYPRWFRSSTYIFFFVIKCSLRSRNTQSWTSNTMFFVCVYAWLKVLPNIFYSVILLNCRLNINFVLVEILSWLLVFKCINLPRGVHFI
jgi:hypothetical protein